MKVIYKLVKFISSIFSTFLITIFITTTNAKAGVEEGIDIRRVQTILTELCYNPGPIDGAWGRKTEAAISKYFSDIGRAYSGSLTLTGYEILSKEASSKGGNKLSKRVIHYDNFKNQLSRKYLDNQIPKCQGNARATMQLNTAPREKIGS